MPPAWTGWWCRTGGRRRAAGAAAKASAGALSHVRMAEVVNIARAIEELKELGVWSVGLAGEADQAYDQVDLTGPTALVMGAEGPGLRRLVRETCDFLVSIPMRGHVGSLNVSVAAGVALFEAVRQRRASGVWTSERWPRRARPDKDELDPLCPRRCRTGTGSAIICSLSGWRSSVR